MWDQGGQPWPQWPLSQQQWMQSFQHQQDPGQVDWAALAQAWIAQKESTGAEQPNIQPNGQDIPGLEPVGQTNHGAFQGDPAFGRMWQPEWGMHGQPPPPPPPPDQAWIPPGSGPMDVVNPSEDSNSQDSVEFNSEAHHGVYPQNSHGYGAQPDSYAMAPMAMNQFDYQHGAASSFAPTPTGFHSPYWQGPPQNRRDTRPPGFRDRPRSPIQLPVKQEAPATLDAVKRRTLPAWIREGLEKMDREKQKKLERERMEKERAKMAKDDGKGHEADEEGDGPRVPRKSKFDSDDEGNEDNDDEEKTSMKKEFSGRSPSPPAEDSEPEMTEEEKEFQLMIITKTLLTEILLEVTNEEIMHVAKETHRKATRGGLGDYGSDESGDEDERSVRGSESSDTDEEELRHRIREKQDAFRRKEREMLQLQEKQAQEAVLAREEMAKERLSREKGEYDEGQPENPHKQEVKEREAEPLVERRRSRSEKEGSESRHSGRGKERSGRGSSESPANGHSSSSRSTSSHSSRRSSSSSSSSSVSSRSSSRSSSPRRKRRRSRSSSHKARRRSRSHSSHRHRSDRSEKVRDRRRSSAERSGRHKKDRSDSRERRSRRSRSRERDRGRARARDSRSRSRDREREKERDKERKRSRDTRDGSHSRSSKHKQKASSKDRERRRERSHSHEKDKKKKEKDREKESDKRKERPKAKEKEKDKEKGSSVVTEENGKLKKRKESDSCTDSQSDKHSRQDSKASKKGSAKASKRRSDSDSSRSPTPEVSKEKKSKKSKRSRSRSTEKSHKSGKKASRKHKSKSRSSMYSGKVGRLLSGLYRRTPASVCGLLRGGCSWAAARRQRTLCLQRSRQSTVPCQLSARSASYTTVDPDEVRKFQSLARKWWDEQGEFAALHAMNDLRVPFIRDNLLSVHRGRHPGKPLAGLRILDVGCGGGLLTEPLGRLGANVLGIDPVEDSIGTARLHSSYDPDLQERICYRASTLEELSAEEGKGQFDAVVASEVVEHLTDLETFAFSCCSHVLLKPGGSLFITTINKTNLSYALGIVAAEQLLCIVPSGTHDWEKFISPVELERLLESNGFSVQSVQGMLYNPVSGAWSWINSTSINYALHAVRARDDPQPEQAEGSGSHPEEHTADTHS
ncbi:hypothetical protein L3Q82_002490 [Scortum barcoo]|uniref:Uncharacterized protein n=1 Tax=Scortum barcoo TaxID=214431 RepID=A0ACB8VYW7_9TELE|nr:hypothetical protein L3Q82_002490 [Scortum barcoo]